MNKIIIQKPKTKIVAKNNSTLYNTHTYTYEDRFSSQLPVFKHFRITKKSPQKAFFDLRNRLVELGDTASPSELSLGYHSTQIVTFFISAFSKRNKKQKLLEALTFFSNSSMSKDKFYFHNMIISYLWNLDTKPALNYTRHMLACMQHA